MPSGLRHPSQSGPLPGLGWAGRVPCKQTTATGMPGKEGVPDRPRLPARHGHWVQRVPSWEPAWRPREEPGGQWAPGPGRQVARSPLEHAGDLACGHPLHQVAQVQLAPGVVHDLQRPPLLSC